MAVWSRFYICFYKQWPAARAETAYGGTDLFAHFSAIQGNGFKSLRENQKVSYDVTTGPKGDQATNIRPLD